MRQLIDTLKDIIHDQTALIESTKAELQDVKHDQNVLQAQHEKLHEDVRGLRTQIEALPSTAPTRSWAAVAASGSNPSPQLNHQRPNKDQNCVRISTQQSVVNPGDNDNSDGNAFGRYLPTETANNHFRTALLNAPSTQDAGIGTTKTGYEDHIRPHKMAPRPPLSKLHLFRDMIESQPLTTSQMVEEAECSQATITNIRRSLRRFGSVYTAPTRIGQKRTMTPLLIEALCDHLSEKPSTYIRR